MSTTQIYISQRSNVRSCLLLYGCSRMHWLACVKMSKRVCVSTYSWEKCKYQIMYSCSLFLFVNCVLSLSFLLPLVPRPQERRKEIEKKKNMIDEKRWWEHFVQVLHSCPISEGKDEGYILSALLCSQY